MTVQRADGSRRLPLSEISSHNNSSDCWVIVHKKVWDITSFLPSHPGGPEIIMQYAGKDATTAYDEIHAPGIIEESLSSTDLKGHVTDEDLASLPKDDKPTASPDQPLPATPAAETAKPYTKPPLDALLNLADFEEVASKSFSPKAWAFYSSAATDLLSHRLNTTIYSRVLFRPRVLRNVTNVSTRSSILGYPISLPIFIAPCAMARLAHPDGELAQARAAKDEEIVQVISTNASFPLAEITRSSIPTPQSQPQQPATEEPPQTLFLQLYVNKSRPQTAALLNQARSLGIKAIFLTIDCPVAGKREADERLAHDTSLRAPNSASSSAASADAKGGGLARLMGQYIDASLSWDDIPWIWRAAGGLPIVLKGVQSSADVRRALAYVRWGVRGVVLSNHGGRSLDTSPPPLLTLLEVWKAVPEAFDTLEVYVDGGIRRGTDVVKALALGARAVGVGRPFLYGLAYGQEGCNKVVQVLRDEIETTLRMLGITDIRDLHPGLLNTRDIDHLVPDDEGEEHPYAGRRRDGGLKPKL